MIITRTPFRISFVGGGSDLKAFYQEHQGAVLSTTINKYMYISSHDFFNPETIRVKYSKTEEVQKVEDLSHPIFKEVLKSLDIKGVEISSIADVPSGTGMGSSSAFTVGLLHNLYTLKRQFVTKEQLALEACQTEIDKLKEPIGKQDQYAAAYGGFNIIRFNGDETVDVEPVFLPKDIHIELQSNLLMFYTGSQRSASKILATQTENTKKADKKAILKEMVSLVNPLRDELYKGNVDAMGQLLHKNWLLKKQLANKISNPIIDSAYDLAMKNGALGGKLLGAGGGGFLLFYCPKKKQKGLIEALNHLREFEFKFEREGSKIIYIGY